MAPTPGTDPIKARLGWLLSGLRVIPVGDEEAKAASALLTGPGCPYLVQRVLDSFTAELRRREHRHEAPAALARRMPVFLDS